MIGHKLPQFKGFINQTELMLDDRNSVLNKTSVIAKRWQAFQDSNPKLAKVLNLLMIDATVDGIDPSLTDGKTGNGSIDKLGKKSVKKVKASIKMLKHSMSNA